MLYKWSYCFSSKVYILALNSVSLWDMQAIALWIYDFLYILSTFVRLLLSKASSKLFPKRCRSSSGLLFTHNGQTRQMPMDATLRNQFITTTLKLQNTKTHRCTNPSPGNASNVRPSSDLVPNTVQGSVYDPPLTCYKYGTTTPHYSVSSSRIIYV